MSERPLREDARVDEPGLVGARWWQDSVVDPVGRRHAILGLLGVGVGLGVAGVAIEACAPTKKGRLGALDLQRKYGWSFGAATESLVFNGVSTEPYDASRIGNIVGDLAPRVASHRPFYVQTLFEAPSALPQAVAQGDPTPIPSLKDALRPICTDSMKTVFAAGQKAAPALAAIPGLALVVDLDGPEAVAFAAGVSQSFDPVFLFDNWPHPRGVVPAHLTLAAAVYYQPMLASAQHQAPPGPPAFVLDDRRLATYSDDAAQFDNRYVARMPGHAALESLGVKRIGYVVPFALLEADDLNDDFVADRNAGIAITFMNVSSLGSFGPTTALPDYEPRPRSTPFSSGAYSGTRPTPAQFGSVPVEMGIVGGALLGVAWSRSGTWNRGGGGWGGG